MSRREIADVTVLGGLPVTVEFWIAPAEPDVGISSDYLDDWHVIAINGVKCKKTPEWLHKKINADPKGKEKLEEDLLNQ